MKIAEKIIAELYKTKDILTVREEGKLDHVYDTPETKLMWTGMKAAAWEAWKKCFETTITNVDHIPSETDFNVIIKPAFESWWEQELLEENV